MTKIEDHFWVIMTIIVFVIAFHFIGSSITVTTPLVYIGSAPINNPYHPVSPKKQTVITHFN